MDTPLENLHSIFEVIKFFFIFSWFLSYLNCIVDLQCCVSHVQHSDPVFVLFYFTDYIPL